MPLTAILIEADPGHQACGDQGCPIRYVLRITNPMNQAAYVQECIADDPPLDLWTGGPPSGRYIAANGHLRADAASFIQVDKAKMPQLVGVDLSCQGLDWHGNLPP